MKNIEMFQQGHCECGQSAFSVQGRPLLRFICHCLICQKIYQKPYADVIVFSDSSVQLLDRETVHFQKHRLPPAVNRGLCKSCSKPVLGFMSVAPFYSLAFVPAMNLTDQTQLPPCDGHVFYHRHVQEIKDDLPKINGYWASQIFLTHKLFKQFLP